MSLESKQHPLQVLIIDDDQKFCRLLREYLVPFGFTVSEARDGLAGVRQVNESTFDAVLLDLMLPGLSGVEVLRRLGTERRVPVLMLTARGEEADRIIGLEMGADDYVQKTVSPREILARLRALIRRNHRQDRSGNDFTAQIGDLRIDAGIRQVTVGNQVILLTSFEFDLLVSLAKYAGRIRTRDELSQETASRPQNVFDRSIDVHISSLRRKLGDDPRHPEYIVTVRNTGYMLRRPD